MTWSLIEILCDTLVPPRASEKLVREISLPLLRGLALQGGALPYHDPRIAALVWEIKYYGQRRAAALAGEYLAEQLLAIAGEELEALLLVPVPMHPARRRERGHNQTELLCRATLESLARIGAVGAFRYAPHALARITHTPQQRGQGRAERLRNLRGTMAAQEYEVQGRVCVVIDDVETTGATFAEARRALGAAGAARVHTLALAQS